MSGGSQALGYVDYVVFGLMLAVSAGIGIYFAWVDRGRETSQNFLTGGRSMTAFPIAMSLIASFMSSTTVLSNPAEVYRFGAIFGLFGIGYMLTMMITCETFLPVFYRLGITSTYEYLELRFNKATRLFGTGVFIFQTMLISGIVVYGPALAFNQVTGLHLWGGIAATGIVCTFYCTLGGLKAVAWTDVFQILIMLAGYLTVIVKTVIEQGGVSAIISDSQQGGRLNLWDFDINPMRRHTFWTITIGGTFGWMFIYGANQAQVQRYFACKSLTHARIAVYISGLGLCSFVVSSVFAGMCIYSVYKDCDPWTTGQVSTPDQLMPLLVMDMLAIPGVPGLFFTAVYCGSLSTLSTSINAMTAVTVEDLIRPHTQFSEKQLSRISKALSFLFGILCISMAGLASVMGGMMQTGATISGVLGGPLLGIFTLGILFPFVNSKGALAGLVSGLVASLVVCAVAMISPPPPSMTRPLPLSTEGCSFNTTSGNWSTPALPTEASIFTTSQGVEQDDGLLTPSYLYFSVIGCITTIIVGLVVSLSTGGLRTRVESKFILNKEDTTVYHIFRFFQDRLIKQTRTTDLTLDKEEGKTNPAFCDSESIFSTSL